MVLLDYLGRNLDVVFCGTAVGNRSAKHGHYYAGRGNRFWEMLHITGLTPEKLTPEQDSRVNEFGIGLTDLVKLHSGNDNTLRREMFDLAGIHQKILKYSPRFLAFNGREASRVFLGLKGTGEVRIGLQERSLGTTRIVALPSTSGSARSSWEEQPWHELAKLIRSAK